MSDSIRPNVSSGAWYNGYQRILLPQQLTGVTRIELTIESAVQGYGRTGATITDIIVASGSHATATPYTRVTATPQPYVQYITPTPPPQVPRVAPPPPAPRRAPSPPPRLVRSSSSRPLRPVMSWSSPRLPRNPSSS